MPKRSFGRFRRSEKGVSLRRINRVTEAVERMDTIGGGRNICGTITAFADPTPTSICMVRLTENVGPDESSEFRDRTGILQWYDATEYKWKDTYPEYEVNVVTMPYGHFPVPENTKVLCWYHRQAGKYVVINNPQVLHCRTVDPAVGSYPSGANSNTFPIAYITTEYENELDVTELDWDYMEDDVDRLTPSPPHGGKSTADTTDEKYGYVYNLGEGFIPKGTNLHAWFYCGQLYTYYSGGGVIGRTKTGGISAMAGSTWPYQLGSGTIDVAEINGTMELIDGGSDLVVYNSTHWTVPADTVVQIKYVYGVPFVDVDDCPINGS